MEQIITPTNSQQSNFIPQRYLETKSTVSHETFIEKIRNVLGYAPNEVVPGKVVRFATSEKHGDEAGWARLFDDGQGGVFGCFRSGISEKWQASTCLSIKQRQAIAEHVTRSRRNTEHHNSKAATIAWTLWEAGSDATGNPYLQRKAVSPTSTLRQIDAVTASKIIGFPPKSQGTPLEGPLLIVPLKSGDNLTSAQLIDRFGRKYFLFGGKLKGAFWESSPLPSGDGSGLTVLLAEGVATTLSCKEATGHLAISAMSCGNLGRVAEELRRRYPEARLVVCSDKGNGEADARKAAIAASAELLVPEIFGNGTDFNDLAQLKGLEAVREQIERIGQIIFPVQDALKQPSVSKTGPPSVTPLLFDDIETPDIPADLLPGWLGEHASAVARFTQTPAGMSSMLALSTLAACSAKRFVVAPYGPGYAEPLNLWTVTALPPASRKSAVVSAMTAPLVEWEKAEAARLAPELRRADIERRAIEKRIDILEKKAATSDAPEQRESFIKEIEQLESELPEELRTPRLWTGDTTPERLQSLLVDHGERMAVLTDEGGIFEVMGGLYSDGRANLDIFLQGHAGQAVRVDRQSRTAHLDAPALSFGLAVQPAVLAELGSGSKRRFRGNGTLARFLYCIPRSNIGNRNVRNIHPIPEAVANRYREAIFELLSIPPRIIDNREHPRRLTLSSEALVCWQAFSEMIEQRQGEGGDLEMIQDWSGKLPGAALRIAGNFHLVSHGATPPDQIEARCMENVLDLCTLLIDHAKAAFSIMVVDSATTDAKTITKWIIDSRLSRFKKGDLWAKFKGRFTGKTDRLDKALRELEVRFILSTETEHGNHRPASVYLVNPALWEEA